MLTGGGEMGEYAGDNRAAEMAINLFSHGSYGEIVQYRIANFGGALIGSIFQSVSVFAMFLLGLYAGKRQFLVDIETNRAVFKRWLVGGLIVGIPGNILYLWGGSMMSGIGFTLGATGLCFAYIGGLTLLSLGAGWSEWLRPLTAVGRMALTNYILQSVIATFIFYSYGLGLYEQVKPMALLLISIGIFAAQVPFSVWWLNRFRFGPLEWVWRSLTYGKWQGMRKKQGS